MDARLHMVGELRADPLADDTIASIVGAWTPTSAALNAEQFSHLAEVNRLLATWVTNGDLLQWPTAELGRTATPHIVKALQKYLDTSVNLPQWAQPDEIALAEEVFFENGPISCAVLFCASLPECYVLPDLADVLHAAGQLEKHTDYRVRSTAAMIFPVMVEGGLTSPEGSGVAQILKVRLIHATIRNLILRGHPQALTLAHATAVPALFEANAQSQTMFSRLFSHGWDVKARGLPCNQNELAYTLLTFSYVFLRAMRTLRAELSEEEENSVLHTWNVVGHILGIERSRLPTSMSEAAAMFSQFQKDAAENFPPPDVRPALGKALLNTMQANIPLPIVRYAPAYLTSVLCGPATARTIGADAHIPSAALVIFKCVGTVTGLLDWIIQRLVPEFSFTKLAVRMFGLHAIERILLNETRPLQLPSHILNVIKKTNARWRAS